MATTETPTADAAIQTEEWTYIGRRIGTGGDHDPRFLRLFPDVDQRMRWHAADRETEAQRDAPRQARKAAEASRGDLGTMTLAEAAHWYQRSPFRAQRAARLAVILHYLESGTLPTEA